MIAAPVATGISYGTHPIDEHATSAVRTALDRAALQQASSVLLFMTPEYLANPEAALRLAAREAGCVQVAGAVGYGLLTEEEWLLDSPGVAAMVFGAGCGLVPRQNEAAVAALAIATPSGFDPGWLHDPLPHIGGVAGDPLGQGGYQVWQGGRVQTGGHIELGIQCRQAGLAVAQGIKPLTAPRMVQASEGLEVVSIDDVPALDLLLSSLPENIRRDANIPLHHLLSGVVFGKPDNAIREGRFHLDHIISADPENHSITLTSEVQPGEHIFLAMRDTYAAEISMHDAVDRASAALDVPPDFGLLFPCLGRGPSFYNGRDRDLEILIERYPGLPVIGFYGNGEIGPLMGGNHTFQYSTALGLFSALDADD